ncbi:MAG: response regulator [Gemmatimonadota bacterium]
MTHEEREGGRGWRIVLAEDDDDHALLIERALDRAASRPVELHRAENGDEVLDLVVRIHPDLVLLDLRMPGRSGHEVLESLKGDDMLRRIPVAVLTSSDRDEDVARSYGLGGNHFITKPEDPAVLERRLRTLLANLAELSGVRRGASGPGRSAVSAMDPSTLAARKAATWIAVVAVLLGLAAYAYFSGAFF